MAGGERDPGSEGGGAKPLADEFEIRDARADEVEELLPLMRAYCDFYESNPADDGLREMAASLIADPSQGALLIARREGGAAVGFAAMAWKWSSLNGARIGFLDDLFVDPGARGGGVADALIGACAELCRERGMPVMEWLTAPDNDRAQAVYDRLGGTSEAFLEYELRLEHGSGEGPAH